MVYWFDLILLRRVELSFFFKKKFLFSFVYLVYDER